MGLCVVVLLPLRGQSNRHRQRGEQGHSDDMRIHVLELIVLSPRNVLEVFFAVLRRCSFPTSYLLERFTTFGIAWNTLPD